MDYNGDHDGLSFRVVTVVKFPVAGSRMLHTAASSSRHRQIRQNDSDPKLFAAYYMKKDSQSLRENLRNQNTIKYTSYEGDAIRAPSRRGRKKRVKEAFAKE